MALFTIGVIAYWLPTIIAFRNQKSSRVIIAILNFLFAGTGIGWVILLFWALRKDHGINQLKALR
nr:superinfection immunity protein [Bacillus alkalicola]